MGGGKGEKGASDMVKAPTQGRSQGPDFGGGASSFKGCRATSPPGKFKNLYRVSEILKNRCSPILEVWARRIYETIKLIENRNDKFALD